jgi:RNA polymerase sigma factor (sigma-70 family)
MTGNEPLHLWPQTPSAAQPEGESDRDLLQRVSQRREADAYATLLQRHGPMVLAVCRRILKDAHLAEDAFQETFLLLARQAGAIMHPELLGSWLYRVAHRIAMHARVRTQRQRARETGVNDLAATPSVEGNHVEELAAQLDAELKHLPEKYRAPLVLCYLQGKTNQEAALLLGWPKGTVQVRLARGRDHLRRRLARRGVTLSAGVTLFMLTRAMAGAAVPPALAVSTLQASVCWAGKALASAMFMARLKVLGVVLGSLATLAAAVTIVAAMIGSSPTAPPAAPITPVAPAQTAVPVAARPAIAGVAREPLPVMAFQPAEPKAPAIDPPRNPPAAPQAKPTTGGFSFVITGFQVQVNSNASSSFMFQLNISGQQRSTVAAKP